MIEIKTYPQKPEYTGTKVLDGATYQIKITWNTFTGKWYMALSNLADDTVTTRPIALLPGKDLLGQFGYGHLLGELYCEDTKAVDTGRAENPTYAGMGDRWRLRYYPRVS